MSDLFDWHDVETDQAPDDESAPVPATVAPAAPVAASWSNVDPECQARRELVLRHPEIATRLTQPPLRYSRPEVWNGWVPPFMWGEQINNSPRRAALIVIVAEAEKASKDGDPDSLVQGR